MFSYLIPEELVRVAMQERVPSRTPLFVAPPRRRLHKASGEWSGLRRLLRSLAPAAGAAGARRPSAVTR